jgi:hypothetical protein
MLIDGIHILTAGHCGCGEPESYRVIIDDDLNPTQTIKFGLSGAPVLFDQRVCRNARLYGNDLALLTLKVAFHCDVAVAAQADAWNVNGTWIWQGTPAPADCRPADAQNAPGRSFGFSSLSVLDLLPTLRSGVKLTAVGYGYTEKHVLGRRAFAQIPIASANCTEPQFAPYCAPFAEMILASAVGTQRRTDTCKGDSGGPIFLINEIGYTLIGITSRNAPGVDDDPILHCGGGGIYTLLGRRSVQDWLLANGVGMSGPVPPVVAAKPN